MPLVPIRKTRLVKSGSQGSDFFALSRSSAVQIAPHQEHGVIRLYAVLIFPKASLPD